MFAFSAAKSHEEFKKIQRTMFKGNQVIPFNEFQERVKELNINYNRNWLRAEYNSAVRQGTMASKWQDVEDTKDVFPYLQYKTANDGRVRASHKKLHDKILPVDDPFWQNFTPPNGWGCRCYFIKLSEAQELGNSREMGRTIKKETPKAFRNNPGQSKEVFKPENHDYFKSNPNKLNAVKDYGLRSFSAMSKQDDLPALPANTFGSPQSWFKANSNRGVLDVYDRWGVIYPLQEKEFIRLATKKKGRDAIAHSVTDVVLNADEVWHNMYKIYKTVSYIKYYDDKAIIVQVDQDANKIRTIYQLDNNPEKARVGILLHVGRP